MALPCATLYSVPSGRCLLHSVCCRTPKLVAERTLNFRAFRGKGFQPELDTKKHIQMQNKLSHPKEEMHTVYITDGLIKQTAVPQGSPGQIACSRAEEDPLRNMIQQRCH